MDFSNPQLFAVPNGMPPGFNGVLEKTNNRAFAAPIRFDQDAEWNIDLVAFCALGKVDAVRTIYVDNSLNSAPFIIVGNALVINYTIPAYSQGFIPVMVPASLMTLRSAGGVIVNTCWLNFDVAPAVWSAASPSSPVSPTQLATDYFLSSGAGNIAAGHRAYSIFNSGAAAGTVKGIAFPVGGSISFGASDFNNTLSGIAYDATGTQYMIAVTG